jgi:hypothetical protein
MYLLMYTNRIVMVRFYVCMNQEIEIKHLEKLRLTTVGIRRADHATPLYPQ